VALEVPQEPLGDLSAHTRELKDHLFSEGSIAGLEEGRWGCGRSLEACRKKSAGRTNGVALRPRFGASRASLLSKEQRARFSCS